MFGKVDYRQVLICAVILVFSGVQVNAQKIMPQFSDFAADVDPHSGSATMGVPIQVPQGRGGIQPNINLQYNSKLRNGIFGVGWTVELGAIQRLTTKGKPTYDNAQDEFCLMQAGSTQGLVYDSSAGFYRTKVEGSFSRTEFINNTYWLVTDKKGIKYYFGEDLQSRERDPSDTSKVFKWLLNKVEDVHGNTMTFTYERDNEKLYPKEILYTSNPGQSVAAHAKVIFVLEDRPDDEFSYISGFKTTTAKRIQEIQVEADGQLQRNYVLNYSQSAISDRSILSSITMNGSDNSTTYPTTTFSYHDETGFQEVSSQWTIPSGIRFSETPDNFSNLHQDLGVRPIDVNGDNYPDMVRSNIYYGGTNSCQPATDPECNEIYETYLHNGNDGWVFTNDWEQRIAVTAWASGGSHFNPMQYTDLNGDSYIDVLYYISWDHSGGGESKSVTLNNGVNGWDPNNSSWHPPSPHSIKHAAGQFAEIEIAMGTVVADVNGDGFPDYVRSKEGTNGDHKTFISNAVDDGIGWTYDASWNVPSGTHTDFSTGALLLDLNGDGLPDIFYKSGSTVSVYMNNGSNWELDSSSPWADTSLVINTASSSNMRLVDMNADGLNDIVYRSSNTARTYINTGHGWREEPGFRLSEGDFENYGIQVFDANADGMNDYMIYFNDEIKLYLNQGKPSDLLYEIDNGLGGITTIEYASSAHFDNTFLPFITPVVKTVTVSDSRGDSYSTEYEYKNGLWDIHERQFRGFGEVKIIDPELNYSISKFAQDEYDRGRLLEQASYDASDNLFAKTLNTWDEDDIITDKSKFVFLKRKDNFVYDGDSSAKRTAEEFFYDETTQYGNLTKAIQYGEVNVSDGADIGNDTRTVDTFYAIPNTTDWIIGLPRQTQVKNNSGTLVRQSWFYYDGQALLATPTQGLLTKKQDWLDSSNDSETSYEYDVFGNLVKTIAPNQVAASSSAGTTITYDGTYHIFPLTTTNALNHSVINTYYGVNGQAQDDGLWGQLKSTEDPNQEVGLRKYDVLGRLIQTISPLDSTSFPTQITEYTYASDHLKVKTRQRVTHGQAQTIDSVAFVDGLGRTIQTQSVSGKSGQIVINGQTEYNSRGLPIKQYLPYFKTASIDSLQSIDTSKPATSITYDDMGRTVETRHTTDNTYASVAYDDWTTTTIDENGHMQKSHFDAYGRLITKEEYSGADGRYSTLYTATSGSVDGHYTLYATTTYEYDSEGNLLKTKDTLNNETIITYDSLGRKISMNDPDMGVWTYTYDANGNLKTQTDNKGTTITFTYDDLNRLTNKSDGGSLNVDYTYDTNATPTSRGTGRLGNASYAGGQTDFEYDELGREVQSIKEIDNPTYDVQRKYDAINNLLEVQYPNNEKIHYKYNDAGQIEQISTDPALFNQSSLKLEDRELRVVKKQKSFFAVSLGLFEEYVLGVKPAHAQETVTISGSPDPAVDGTFVEYAMVDGVPSYQRQGLVNGLQYYIYRRTWTWDNTTYTAWYVATVQSGWVGASSNPYWWRYNTDVEGTFQPETAQGATGVITATITGSGGGAVCGNSVVETGETCDGGSQSCTINGYSGTENCNSSCSGYDACTTNLFCGDGICTAGAEDATSCSADCSSGGGGTTGTITRDIWENIGGSTSITSLTGQTSFPDSPDVETTLTSFEAPSSYGNEYGQRIYGYIHPPTTGTYTFWIASDDHSELWLSTDSGESNKALIADVSGYTSSQQWDKYASQQSVAIALTAGQKYYIEVLHKEGGGGDHVAVAWETSGITRTVIDGQYLSPFSSGGAVCGNSVVETGETCDGGSQSCTINGYSGTQDCNSSCSGYDACTTNLFCGDGICTSPPEDSTSCSADCGSGAVCGNSIVETGETCDGGSQSCTINGYPGIEDCNSSCSGYDACTTTLSCGDGVCTAGAEDSTSCPADCSSGGSNTVTISGSPDPAVDGTFVEYATVDGVPSYQRQGLVNGLQYYIYRRTWTWDNTTYTAWYVATVQSGWVGASSDPYWWRYNLDVEGDFQPETGQGATGVISATLSSGGGGAVCGNSIVETGETCDGGSQSCTINGYSGTENCNSSCSGYDTCTTSLFCGDGICTAGAEDATSCSADCSSGGGGTTGTITREVWQDIGGSVTIASLTGNADYPDSPDISEEITSLEGPSSFGDSYGTRIRGYIHPPTTGNYTFWISGDDHCELWLSTDDSENNKALIADVPGYTSSRQWDKYPEQESVTIALTAGQKYYIEALHKEAGGGDHVAVAWETTGISRTVIDGQYLSPINGGSGGGSTDELIVENVEYNAAGQIERIEYGNGVVTVHTYDGRFRLKTIVTTHPVEGTLQDLEYTYDAIGNVVKIEDHNDVAVEDFTYDHLNRLVKAEAPQDYGTKDYAYDEIGNITLKDGNTYLYAGTGNAGPHAVTGFLDGTNFNYDENGNMVSRYEPSSGITTLYEYDIENRLTGVREGSVYIEEYEYDGDGGRTRRHTHDGGTTITTFVGSLYEEEGLRQTQFVYMGDMRIASITDDKIMYVHANHLGSVHVLTDKDGVVKEEVEYEPYGKIRERIRNSSDPAEFAHYYFTGQREDSRTGLYYYGARYYNPDIGKFLTPDTIVPNPNNPQHLNRYTYVYNNPVSYIDPDGHFGFLAVIFKAAITIAKGVAAVANAIRPLYDLYNQISLVYNIAAGNVDFGQFALGMAASNIIQGLIPVPGFDNSGLQIVASAARGAAIGAARAAATGQSIGQAVGASAGFAAVGATLDITNGGTKTNASQKSDNVNSSPGAINAIKSVVAKVEAIDKFVKDITGKVWSLPNTALGLALGVAGSPFVLLSGENPFISIGDNAINIRFPIGGGAIALGNVVLYAGTDREGNPFGPNTHNQRTRFSPVVRTGTHERQHTYQAQKRGPLYLPAYGIEFLFTGYQAHSQEIEADNYAIQNQNVR